MNTAHENATMRLMLAAVSHLWVSGHYIGGGGSRSAQPLPNEVEFFIYPKFDWNQWGVELMRGKRVYIVMRIEDEAK